MGRPKKNVVEEKVKEVVQANPTADLASALRDVVETIRGPQKKNPFNRKINTPWTKDGVPKLKLKRKMYQHGILIDPDRITNEEIELLNKLRPGRYVDGLISVERRRDKGVNFTYPVKTAASRMRILNVAGGRGLVGLLTRIIEEQDNPVKFTPKDWNE